MALHSSRTASKDTSRLQTVGQPARLLLQTANRLQRCFSVRSAGLTKLEVVYRYCALRHLHRKQKKCGFSPGSSRTDHLRFRYCKLTGPAVSTCRIAGSFHSNARPICCPHGVSLRGCARQVFHSAASRFTSGWSQAPGELTLDRQVVGPSVALSAGSLLMTWIMTCQKVACRAAFALSVSAERSDAGPEIRCSCQGFRPIGHRSQSFNFPSTVNSTVRTRD